MFRRVFCPAERKEIKEKLLRSMPCAAKFQLFLQDRRLQTINYPMDAVIKNVVSVEVNKDANIKTQ